MILYLISNYVYKFSWPWQQYIQEKNHEIRKERKKSYAQAKTIVGRSLVKGNNNKKSATLESEHLFF